MPAVPGHPISSADAVDSTVAVNAEGAPWRTWAAARRAAWS
ncbi:hypothetical protein [Streptomyces sp. NPDC097610]